MMRCVFWIGVLLLVSVGASKAAPMDAPDTIYIDGQPCSSFCQSYMAWSRAVSNGMTQAAPKVVTRRVARVREAKPHARDAKQSALGHAALRHAALRQAALGHAALEHAAPGVKETAHVAHVKQEPPSIKEAPSAPSVTEAPPPTVKEEPPAQIAIPRQAGDVAPEAKPSAGNSPPNTGLPETTSTVTPAAERKSTRPVRELVMAAAAVAEQLTTGVASSQAASPPESGKPDSAAPSDGGTLVALVMSRPEIKSVADLTGTNVAIDQGHSLSQTDVRTALVAAGATDVQLSAEDGNAIDRLVNGEVPAAVVALVSTDAAQAFPDIAGFRVFRVPLSPRS